MGEVQATVTDDALCLCISPDSPHCNFTNHLAKCVHPTEFLAVNIVMGMPEGMNILPLETNFSPVTESKTYLCQSASVISG